MLERLAFGSFGHSGLSSHRRLVVFVSGEPKIPILPCVTPDVAWHGMNTRYEVPTSDAYPFGISSHFVRECDV